MSYLLLIKMIDPYYKLKSELHKTRPTFGILCFAWMLFNLAVVYFFGTYVKPVENNAKCYVRPGE